MPKKETYDAVDLAGQGSSFQQQVIINNYSPQAL